MCVQDGKPPSFRSHRGLSGCFAAVRIISKQTGCNRTLKWHRSVQIRGCRWKTLLNALQAFMTRRRHNFNFCAVSRIYCAHRVIRRSSFRSSGRLAHARPQPPLPAFAERWQQAGWRPLLSLPSLLLLPPASTPRCELLFGYKVTPERDLISVTGNTNDIIHKVFYGGFRLVDHRAFLSPGEGKCPLFVTVFGAEEERDERAAACLCCSVNFSRPSARIRDCPWLNVWIHWSFRLLTRWPVQRQVFTPGLLADCLHPRTARPKPFSPLKGKHKCYLNSHCLEFLLSSSSLFPALEIPTIRRATVPLHLHAEWFITFHQT